MHGRVHLCVHTCACASAVDTNCQGLAMISGQATMPSYCSSCRQEDNFVDHILFLLCRKSTPFLSKEATSNTYILEPSFSVVLYIIMLGACTTKTDHFTLFMSIDFLFLSQVLVFFKVAPTVITPDNLHSNVFVSSMLDSPLQGLYHAIEKVWAPILLESSKWSQRFDGKLQRLLTELATGLSSAVRKHHGGGGKDFDARGGACQWKAVGSCYIRPKLKMIVGDFS